MNKYLKIVLLVIIALVLAYLVIYPRLSSSTSAGPSQAGASGPSVQKIPVSAVIVKPKVLEDKITVSGSIVANESLELKSEISGKIVGIYFLEGSEIKAGELLVKINDDELQAELEKWKHNIKLLEESEFRQRQLLQREAISQEEYDISLTELNTIKAELKLVQAKLAKTQIRAPLDGIIGLRHVSGGSYVTPTERIASIYSIDPAKVDFAIPEKYSNRVSKGDLINFSTDAIDGWQVGKVFAIEPQIDQATRTLMIRAIAANPNNLLLPGQFTRIEMVFNKVENAIMVPSEAVIPELGGHRVFVHKQGKAESMEVGIGIRTDRELEIVSGLHPNDTVITSGILQIRSGVDVSISTLN